MRGGEGSALAPGMRGCRGGKRGGGHPAHPQRLALRGGEDLWCLLRRRPAAVPLAVLPLLPAPAAAPAQGGAWGHSPPCRGSQQHPGGGGTHQQDGVDGGGGQDVVPQDPAVTGGGHEGQALFVDLGAEWGEGGRGGGQEDTPLPPPQGCAHLQVTPDAMQPRQALEALDLLLALAALTGLAATLHPDMSLDLRTAPPRHPACHPPDGGPGVAQTLGVPLPHVGWEGWMGGQTGNCAARCMT